MNWSATATPYLARIVAARRYGGKGKRLAAEQKLISPAVAAFEPPQFFLLVRLYVRMSANLT
jgi:hypothetical protein